MRNLYYCLLLTAALTLTCTAGDTTAAPAGDARSPADAASARAPEPLAAEPPQKAGDGPAPAATPPAPAPETPQAAQAAGAPQALPEASAQRALPPLRTLLTSPFGPRAMPGWLGRGGKPVRMHNAIDIRARIGWPVVAFKGGTVRQAGPNGALGLSVLIRQDDGMTAYYGHLGKIRVSAGQRIEEGTPVGEVGCTGRTTGAHLHFGLHRADGTAVDPLPFLERAEQVLRPAPEQIPAVLEAQACSGPVLRGRNGLPVRMNREFLRRLDSYTPPPIPSWGSR